MKKLFLGSMLMVAASSALLASHITRPRSQRTLTIKVTSADPGQQIPFDASYIFQSGNSQLQHVEQVTPFEVSGNLNSWQVSFATNQSRVKWLFSS